MTHSLSYELYRQDRIDRRAKLISAALSSQARTGRPTGCAPVGYLNERNHLGAAVIVVDAEKSPLVRETFELASTGAYGLRPLLRIMTEKGLVSRTGGRLSPSSLLQMLANPFYAGYQRFGGELLRGSHEAIISAELFDRVQGAMKSRGKARSWR